MEPPTPGSLDYPDLGAALNEVFTPEMKERMIRLEKENEILKRRLEEGNEEESPLWGGERGDGVANSENMVDRERGSSTNKAGRGRDEGGKIEAALRKELRERQKRIAQLEAMTQKTS